VVAGSVRLLPIRSCGLVGWVSVWRGPALSGRGDGRPVAGWAAPSGWGYGAEPGPAPPPSLSGAVYGGDLVRGLGDHVGLAGDAELAESGQDTSWSGVRPGGARNRAGPAAVRAAPGPGSQRDGTVTGP
jgi:hypothetical protein